MKKTFQLHVEGKHPERLLDAIKHEIRQYLKRERRKPLPAQMDFWDFDCRFGLSEEKWSMLAPSWTASTKRPPPRRRRFIWNCWPSRGSAALCRVPIQPTMPRLDGPGAQIA